MGVGAGREAKKGRRGGEGYRNFDLNVNDRMNDAQGICNKVAEHSACNCVTNLFVVNKLRQS